MKHAHLPEADQNSSFLSEKVFIRKSRIIACAIQDKFFKRVVNDLIDFGVDIEFSMFAGAGMYQPFALQTELLDTPEKHEQFVRGFWNAYESGHIKSQIRLSSFSGLSANVHSFLHEAMHFYQDMHGLYLLPLQENGTFPVCLDAHSEIVAIMFCEAWAQTETIRACWSIKEKGDPTAWRGALGSKDWKYLAQAYEYDLDNGMDESKAAAQTFHRWYGGKHRAFYEKHALNIHKQNLARFLKGAGGYNAERDGDAFRKLELPHLIVRIPKDDLPRYFHQVNWTSEALSTIQTQSVRDKAEQLQQRYSGFGNTNIQDIKCGSPPYLWKRLSVSEQKASEIPAHQGQAL